MVLSSIPFIEIEKLFWYFTIDDFGMRVIRAGPNKRTQQEELTGGHVFKYATGSVRDSTGHLGSSENSCNNYSRL
jgi:hypothetical protein